MTKQPKHRGIPYSQWSSVDNGEYMWIVYPDNHKEFVLKENFKQLELIGCKPYIFI